MKVGEGLVSRVPVRTPAAARLGRGFRLWALALAAVGLVVPMLSPSGSSQAESRGAAAPAAARPNIVLILTDDQRWDTLWAMPNVQSELVNRGIVFNNAFVVNSLCCPSRASILTGKYSHTHGVYANGGPHGGYRQFHDEDNTVAVWLNDAGYRTGLMGKYINGYITTDVPPGWDRWAAFYMDKGGDGSYYYNYNLNVDGSLVYYGRDEEDYSTDVLAAEADSFIRTAPTGEPLFLYFAVEAPHLGAEPARRHKSAFRNLPPYRPPNYNEPDVSDKPAWLQARPQLNQEERDLIDFQRKKEYRTLLSVDDAVGTIVDALTETGRLYNTLIVFTSDNGLAWGEHRWNKKQTAYEEAIRVPLVARYDKALADGMSDDHLVANVDFATTFAAAAGVPAPEAEGMDLRPLFTNPDTPWREDLLIEHLQTLGASEIPTYCAVRDISLQPEGFLYVSYLDTGEEELYDLKTDFYQLENLVSDPDYAAELDQLRDREAELCDPLPPG
jgi:N-acetylglucosamine-6-sulfatase